MDIAKIRKKIKEEKDKAQGGTDSSQKTEQGAQSQKEKELPVIAAPQQEPAPRQLAVEEIDTQEPPAPDGVKKDKKAALQAAPAETVKATENIVELLTFQLAHEEFAFRVSDIEEILRLQPITQVPKIPDYVLGLTSLRGKIIPVVDLKKRLSIRGDDSAVEARRKKILILKGARGLFGVLIDKVKGVIHMSPEAITEPPAHLSDSELAFVEGVVLHSSRFISVIKMEEILALNLKQ